MTDEQIRAIFKASVGGSCGSSAIAFARAIIAASASAQPVARRDTLVECRGECCDQLKPEDSPPCGRCPLR